MKKKRMKEVTQLKQILIKHLEETKSVKELNKRKKDELLKNTNIKKNIQRKKSTKKY